MFTESIPIYLFVQDCFERREVKTITDSWRVDVAQIKQVVMDHMLEIGVYQIDPIAIPHMRKVIVQLLENSPEIIRIVKAAERREQLLARVKKSSAD